MMASAGGRSPRKAALLAVLVACKGTPAVEDAAPRPIAIDAPRADAPAIDRAWDPIKDLPHVEPVRVVTIATQPTRPRFDVGGPVLAGDLAIVSSSQFGFAALDWRTGTIAWTKPSGARVAPPIVVGSSIDLIGECTTTTFDVPVGHDLLACLRVVTATGVDLAYIALHGIAPEFAAAVGPQFVWHEPGDRSIRWRRGDSAVSIDLVTGVAKPAPIAPPPLVVTYKDRTWTIERTEERIFAKQNGKEVWTTKNPYSVLVGSVWLADQSPLVRLLRVGPFGGQAEINVLDMDATGSMHGTAAFPVPGLSLLGYGTSAIGDTALAVRLDSSISHDYVAGYAANALLMWVYPLPVTPRADPVGVALAPEAVVVFYDGDTVAILPELAAPATAPGAARAGSLPNPPL